MSFSLTSDQKKQFDRDGYLILKGLISREEAEALRDHFMELHAAGPVPELFHPLSLEEAGNDVLKAYPRFMHPHRVDEMSFKAMLDERLEAVLGELFAEEPIAAQSMFYYKPPGARGQALHQDNFYLSVSPGTCIAAWFALDDIGPENGGLFVVPGSHQTPVQCPHVADQAVSFTTEEVDIPQGMEAVPTHMELGDVLFFNGSLIHGSYPNSSKDKFRRSFICHYIGQSAEKISHWYFPLHRFDGTPVEIGVSEGEGGWCGTSEWEVLLRARNEEIILA